MNMYFDSMKGNALSEQFRLIVKVFCTFMA